MELIRLDPAEYAGRTLTFTYTTDSFYDVRASENGFTLCLTPFPSPREKSFTDELFSDWLEAPVAFGAMEGETLLGVIEGSRETWHRLFRISNLLVFSPFRGRGVGRALMEHMIDYVRTHESVRGIVLETQSCNCNAIRFYKKNGFTLSRIDIREYSNEDVARQEVRLDLFLPL
ncbi:MAG: GNAT family N-acetyltransferase [Eubacteriales bacterium]